MRLQLRQDYVDQLNRRKNGSFSAVDKLVKELPDVLDEVRPVATENVEQSNEYLTGRVALTEAGR